MIVMSSSLFFLCRSEMVEIQLNTYTTEAISGHRKIRQVALCSD